MSVLARIREWQERRREAKVWHFVGFVTGNAIWIDEQGVPKPGGRRSEIHSLFERGDGQRRFHTEGPRLGTQHANYQRAMVKAWEMGGPLPDLDDGLGSPPPEPQTKPKAKLIAFDGGKGAA